MNDNMRGIQFHSTQEMKEEPSKYLKGIAAGLGGGGLGVEKMLAKCVAVGGQYFKREQVL